MKNKIRTKKLYLVSLTMIAGYSMGGFKVHYTGCIGKIIATKHKKIFGDIYYKDAITGHTFYKVDASDLQKGNIAVLLANPLLCNKSYLSEEELHALYNYYNKGMNTCIEYEEE